MYQPSRDCPECGLHAGPDHRCGVPILRHAIGLTLTAEEEALIKWLAIWERETVDRLADLFRRVRSETYLS